MPPSLAVCTGGLLVCAFLAPKPRTIGFCGFAFALCTWLTSVGKMVVLLDLGLVGCAARSHLDFPKLKRHTRSELDSCRLVCQAANISTHPLPNAVYICREAVNANILLQGALYLFGAVLFIRNDGHAR